MPNFIRKRDGSLVPFDAQKIANAIRKAAAPVQDTEAEQKALEIAEEAAGVLELSYRHTVPTVEQVQDIVEALLIRHQLAGTAKSYILYRKQRQELRDSKTFLEEAIDAIDGYLNLNDWRVNENANMGYSLQGLNNNIAAKLSSSYWLNKVYPEHIAKAHSSGQLHLHDLGALSVYCCGWDLQDLLRQGFGGAYGKIESGPPKHFRTALGQITNFFYTLQGEAAGAQAFSNFDTLLAPFVRKDGLGYSEVKQAMQEFIFNLNVPTRVGFQCMSEDTEILTQNGWKGHSEVKEGDIIATFNLGTEEIEYLPVQKMFARQYEGKMYRLCNAGPQIYYDQLISPKHRVVFRAGLDEPFSMLPVEEFLSKNRDGIVYGYLPFFPEGVESLDSGKVDWERQAGICSCSAMSVTELDYSGIIWCPNTKNETVVARRNGKIFITGNTPFTNITMDVTPPSTLADEAVILGGEYQAETYGDYQAEMDMINRAFCEIMMAGDKAGRLFSFPIPTYNLTKEMDWESEKLEPLWAMTAKYGIPYFSNFINSDLSPEDARSMCPLHPDTEVHVRVNGAISILTFGVCFLEYQKGAKLEVLHNRQWYPATMVEQDCSELLKISISGKLEVLMDSHHEQPVWWKSGDGNWAHSDQMGVPAGSLRVGDYVPVVSNGMNILSKIHGIEKVPYSGKVYCFVVDSDEHLFQLANGLVTHNCRLRLDNTELRKRAGGLFAAAPLTGSIGVVTLNLPRAAYTSSTEDEFFQKISNLMVIAYESLEIKRKQLERFTDIGLYPYSKHYLSGIKERSGSYWTNHFSTIGIIGMHEACLNLIGKGIDSQEGKALAVRTLEYIREGLLTFQEASGNLYNLEATPGEGTTYRLASKDKKEFPGIITAGTDEVQYYTNSTHLPVDATTDIFFALEHQDDIQTLYTGGTVLHGFLGERIEDWRLARQLVRKIAENYRLPYYTLTPTFSICPVHGYLPGEHTECPYSHKGEAA